MLKYFSLFLIFFVSPVFSQSSSDAMNNKAKSIGSSFDSKYGSYDSLSENVVSPMTGNGSLSTMNGQSFTGKLACTKQSTFARSYYLPSSTGDIQQLKIMYDSQLKGDAPDKTLSVNERISGVCGNGFYSCDAGTWNNCKAYKWDYKQDEISYKLSNPSLLGGCYCINNSCGSTLAIRNTPQVMRHLLTGAVTPFMEINSGYSISDVTVQDTSAVVTVVNSNRSDSGSCAGGTSPTQSSLMQQPALLSEMGSQNATTNKYYDMVKNSASASAVSGQHKCEIKKEYDLTKPNIDTLITPLDRYTKVEKCGANCLDLTLGATPQNTPSRNTGSCHADFYRTSYILEDPSRIKSTRILDWSCNECGYVLNQGQLHSYVFNERTRKQIIEYPTNKINHCNQKGGSLNISSGQHWTHAIRGRWYSTQPRRVNWVFANVVNSEKSYHFSKHRVEIDVSCRLQNTTIDNDCQEFERKSNCKVWHETVDGVTTVTNGRPTGVTPLFKQTRVSNGVCAMNVNTDYLHKKRTYFCEAENPYDFSNAMERVDKIQSTVNGTSFTDLVTLNNNRQQVNRQMTYYNGADGLTSKCQKTCRIKREIPMSEASSGINVNQYSNLVTKFEKEYRKCSIENVCPISGNEQVIMPCACNSQFNDAFGAMQSVRLASIDMICSSGSKK